MMKFFQRLGKALMLPVACLPLCGLLMGVGYLLCPASMHDGDAIGFAPTVGLFFVKAGGVLIDNMALLFAVGVGVGMSENQDGTGAIAALTSWFMITTLLNLDFVVKLLPSAAGDANRALAFAKITNPFIGILAGVIGALCYNRFKDVKLPDWFAFFSGKRCVAIVAGIVSILFSVVLLCAWPFLYQALISIGQAIAGMGAFGAGVYAFLNRLLIPFGLHHTLNNVFWFDTIGLGDLTQFWAGKTDADVSWPLGIYMSGFFPCMMFGVPGAALAMLRCAKSGNKKNVTGILTSAAICSFACGVTEPFEFAFMFAAPALYVAYAALYGVFTVIADYVHFRAGFAFSAGAADLMFSASLPAAQNTWMIVPLGLAAFVSFYLVFRVMIAKLDLKTPGREAEDEKAESAGKDSAPANRAFIEIAETVLAGVGGRENLVSVDNCITRLRLEIKDPALVDETKIKSAGVPGVIRPSAESVQVVVGQNVQFVAEELKKLCE